MSPRIDPIILKQQVIALLKTLTDINVEGDEMAAALPMAAAAPARGMAAPAASLALTDAQHRICIRVINVFETGKVEGDYGSISLFHDGPNRIQQVTYGRAQTTEYGNLRELISDYVAANGRFSAQLQPFVGTIGTKVGNPPRSPLVGDQTFLALLRSAGSDPVMRETQDVFFDRVYLAPALAWAGHNGFTKALSGLVIYDSFTHSGGILQFLRERFPEPTPTNGGDEKVWIAEYVAARQEWLATAANPELHPTVYRTKDLLREINRDNWDLSMTPILANGTPVDGAPLQQPVPVASLGADFAVPPRGAALVSGSAPFFETAAGAAAAPAADGAGIEKLVALGSNPQSLRAAQAIAAQRLLAFDREVFPHDGCAITLSVLMQQAGIEVSDTFPAIALGQALQRRGWKKIPVGEQRRGDVGSTCGTVAHHGTDHIYLVLRDVNEDEMVVADNQATTPHFRFASGQGKSPTTFFLRASGA
jgi:chitosanase